MANIREIAQDPDFKLLPQSEQLKALGEIEPDLAGLPISEQLKALQDLGMQTQQTQATKTPQPQSLGDSLSQLGNWMEGKRKEWTTPTTQQAGAQTPEWAGKNPIPYGMLGAIREAGAPVAEGVAIGSNITPVGLLSGGLKYAGVRQGVSILDKILGNKGETTLGGQAKEALQDTAAGTAMQAIGGLAVPVAQGVKRGFTGTTTGAAMKEGTNTVKDLSAMVKGIDETAAKAKTTEIVKEYLPAIKPSNKDIKKSYSMGKDFYEESTPSIVNTVINKNSITQDGEKLFQFYDKKGRPLKNNIPQTVEDDLTALRTLKQEAWDKAVTMRNAASGEGATLPEKSMIDKLGEAKAKANASNLADRKATIAYIDEQISNYKRYGGKGVPLDVAQSDLSALNDRLFNKNVQIAYDSSGKIEVDKFVASELRKGLDSVIEAHSGGKEFENIKKLYGSFRMREEATLNTVNRLAKQNKYNLFSESDIWMGYHAGVALLTGSMVPLTAALGAKGAKAYLMGIHNADNKIKTMYKEIDKIVENQSRVTNPQSKFGQGVQKGMADRSKNIAPTREQALSENLTGLGSPSQELKANLPDMDNAMFQNLQTYSPKSGSYSPSEVAKKNRLSDMLKKRK